MVALAVSILQPTQPMRLPLLHRHFLRFLLVSLLLASLSVVVRAAPEKSPLHLSLTEANYDRAKGRLLLTVRVQKADFEAALSERTHRKITAADPGELAPAALDYVREKLHLKSTKGELLRLDWAGLDITETQIFLFFEAPLIGSLQDVRISHTLLQERFADQINSLEIHDGALKQTIVFAHDTGEAAVRLAP
jgi:hypothetical protein